MKKFITFAVIAALTISLLGFPAANYGADAPQAGGVTALKAKAFSDTAIRLTWKKAEQASGYEVYKYQPKKKKYSKVGTVKKNSFRCTKLKADTKYRFKVRAYVSQDGKSYYGAFSKAVKRKTQKSPGQKVIAKAKKKIGAKYKSGAAGPKAFDCSGFVYWVYKNADVKPKKKVKRTSCTGLYRSLKKHKVGSSIKSIKKAKAGDIIFFGRSKRMTHVAIYVGKGKLIHASTPKKGVVSANVKVIDKNGLKVAAIVRVL